MPRGGQQDLIEAMDKRARNQIDQYSTQASLQVGTIEKLTLAGASVRLEGSGRFFKNVASMQGVTLTIGARVLLTRIGRSKWVILGAVEEAGAITPRTNTTTPVAAPGSMSVADTGLGYARIEWDASYFDIRCWELMIGTASVSTASTFPTDNSQYDFEADNGTYYTRVRAVGPEWKRSSWTAWQAFQITSSSALDHGALTGRGDDDHTIYVLADGTRDLVYTPGTLSDWPAGDPGDTDDALDKLAERTRNIESDTLTEFATVQMVTGGASDGTPSEFGDGLFLHVDETTGSPGFDVRFTWTGVTTFQHVLLYASYVGSTTHAIGVQLYNAAQTRWDTFHSLQSTVVDVSTADGYVFGNESFDVPSQWVSDYIDSGVVVLRVYHTTAGNASHDLYIAYAALLS